MFGLFTCIFFQSFHSLLSALPNPKIYLKTKKNSNFISKRVFTINLKKKTSIQKEAKKVIYLSILVYFHCSITTLWIVFKNANFLIFYSFFFLFEKNKYTLKFTPI